MSRKAKKALVVFTTFWDADFLLDNRYFTFQVKDGTYKANLFIKKKHEYDSSEAQVSFGDGRLHSMNGATLSFEELQPTFTLNSIALSHPDFSKFRHIDNMERLDFWCPTYNMLNDYHQDKNWDKYVKKYVKLMIDRKEAIKGWIESLTPNHIYILCCWENTTKEAHCHRQLIHQALLASNKAKEKLFPIYRDGSNKREAEAQWDSLEIEDQPITMPSMLNDEMDTLSPVPIETDDTTDDRLEELLREL